MDKRLIEKKERQIRRKLRRSLRSLKSRYRRLKYSNSRFGRKRRKIRRRIAERLLAFRISFIKKERAISETTAGWVSGFDSVHDDFAEKTEKAVEKGNRRFNLFRKLADRKKAVLLSYFAGIIMVTVLVLVLFNYATGYEYSYNGRVLGVVKDQKNVTDVLDIASHELTQEYSAKIAIGEGKDIQFRRIVTVGRDVDDMEEVLKRLTYMKDINATGYGIYVNGRRSAVLATRKEAQTTLNDILAKFSKAKKDTEYESVGFAGQTDIKQVDTKLVNITDAAESETKLLQGDTAVSVRTVEKTEYTEKVEHKTEKKDNPKAYRGTDKTTVKGRDGKNKVIARITRINGKETGRQILKTTVISKPVTKVVLAGTKKIPPTMGDGHYQNPCPAGYVSSPFGPRWGSFHRGVDLACATGNNIYAADGGTVIYAGHKGSYGNLVVIDHKNGAVTRYGHCSRILVHVGQKVYQGKLIAKVGSTGHATGPHCHFELEINGKLVNPMKYI